MSTPRSTHERIRALFAAGPSLGTLEHVLELAQIGAYVSNSDSARFMDKLQRELWKLGVGDLESHACAQAAHLLKDLAVVLLEIPEHWEPTPADIDYVLGRSAATRSRWARLTDNAREDALISTNSK